MRVGSLFAGIGGFDLAAHWVGWTTRWVSEIDPYASRVLQRHFPEAPNLGDITTITNPPPVDVLCGGFPCQDISVAGKGVGITGSRSGLWSHYARLIGEIRPRWVVIENSPMLRSRGLGVVLHDLMALGYDAEWHCIPAYAVGAPHTRDRVWLVAYPERTGLEGHAWHGPVLDQQGWLEAQQDRSVGTASVCGGEHAEGWRDTEPRFCGVADGVPTLLDGGVGEEELNPEKVTTGVSGTHQLRDMWEDRGALSPSQGLHKHGGDSGVVCGLSCGCRHQGRDTAGEAGTGVSTLREPVHTSAQQEAQTVQQLLQVPSGAHQRHEEMGKWEAYPGYPRVAVGGANRRNRLRCLGNAIVPQVALRIFRAIQAIEDRR